MARKRKGERPDGLIQIRIDIGTNPDGSRKRKSFYGHTRAEAIEKRDAYLRTLEETAHPELMDITVSQWLDRWYKTYNINHDQYMAYINHAKESIGDVMLSSVTEETLIKSMSYYAGKSSQSAEKYRLTLKRAFGKAVRNGLIKSNPADELPLPEGKPLGTHRALSKDEVKVILDNSENGRMGLAASIMILSGLRRGEMVALTWENIDLDNRIIHVRQNAVLDHYNTVIKPHTKTEAGIRDIPISDRLLAILENAPGEHVGFVYKSTKSSGHIGLPTFSMSFDTYMQSIGLKCRPHDLRHTFATFLYEANVDIKAAQIILGHKDIKVTLGIYTHLSEEKLVSNSDRLNTYIDELF